MIRPNIGAMAGYTPGEQPRDGDFIKLNTNESPYPPSPRVFAAIQTALTGDRLRKYPDPFGTLFRRKAAEIHGVDAEMVLIGNGSDDILTILTRAFVPEGGLIVSPTPSYLLYKTLADIQGARFQSVAFSGDWDLPSRWPIRGAHLTLVANPNSPSGTVVPLERLAALADEIDGPLVIDEAYADFAEGNALSLLRRPNIVIVRTLSKSYGLAGIRFGYALASAAIVQELNKVKDSYNCDVLSLAAATAALSDQEYLRHTTSRIQTTRNRLTTELKQLGFDVTPSQANFVWCRRYDRPVQPIYAALKQERLLVRYMRYDGYGDGLRISVGSDAEVDRLLSLLASIL
ncbi:MAG: histidinol-phosphate transaminase [Gemmataceae bacterium]